VPEATPEPGGPHALDDLLRDPNVRRSGAGQKHVASSEVSVDSEVFRDRLDAHTGSHKLASPVGCLQCIAQRPHVATQYDAGQTVEVVLVVEPLQELARKIAKGDSRASLPGVYTQP
jgi:hypothetical protein